MNTLSCRSLPTMFDFNSPLIDRFFTTPYHASEWGSYTRSSTEDSYLLEITVPGAEKDSLKVSSQDGRLSVQAKRGYNVLDTAFSLPAGTDTEGITVEYKDGILHISVPKPAQAVVREIPIKH